MEDSSVMDSGITSRKRISFGAEGLDRALNGGIPKGDVILVSGPTGSGKTILSMQFLVEGAKKGEKGLFFAMEQKSSEVIEQFSAFDKNFINLVNSGAIKLVDVQASDFDSFMGIISSEMESIGAERVVIDSITYFQMFFGTSADIRKAIIETQFLIKQRKATGLLVSEVQYGKNYLSYFGVEEFITDGIVSLKAIKRLGGIVRGLRVIKMRNSSHMTKLCPMEITESGIVVYPENPMPLP